MVFMDYEHLLTFIKEKSGVENMLKNTNIKEEHFNDVISNKDYFTIHEIILISNYLGISESEVGKYFFCPKSWEN